LKAVLDQFRDARPVELDRQFQGEFPTQSRGAAAKFDLEKESLQP
jgi:hypothetical protein